MILKKLLSDISIFAYKVDKIVLFYHFYSPLYEDIAKALAQQGIEFESKRYDELTLSISSLDSMANGNDNHVLAIFDDVYNTLLVQSSVKNKMKQGQLEN